MINLPADQENLVREKREKIMACTVKVSNISPKVTIKDIEEFFTYAGQIESINLSSDGEDSQIAYVAFKDQESLKIAVLLSGSAIVDKEVTVSAVAKARTEELALESAADSHEAEGSRPSPNRPGPINRAQEIVKSMLSRGLFVGKDAMARAKSLDAKSKIESNGDALKFMKDNSNQKSKVSNVDDDVNTDTKNEAANKSNVNEGDNLVSEGVHNDSNITGKDESLPNLSDGKQSKGGVNNMRAGMQKYYKHVCAMNEKLQIGQKTMSALTSAQQGVVHAGSAVANNKFVAAGGGWVSGALSRVSLWSPAAAHDGENAPPHQEHVELTEMSNFSSQKSEHD